MGKCTTDLRLLAVKKLKDGLPLREVSRLLDIPRTTLRHIWKRFLENNTVEYQQKSGRPNKLSVRDRRKLFLESRRYPFFSAREVLVSAGSIQNISVCTVRRILRNAGLLGRVAAKKPLLNRRHIQKRLMWCKSYLQMDKKNWQNFIFTDEARLELYSRRRQYVRRPLGQRFKTRYTLKTVKYGGPSILVWGAI